MGCENETNTRSIEQDKEEYEKPKQTNKDDGNATKGEEDFIQIEQQDTESQNTRIVSDTFEWPRHKDTMEELRGCRHELEDDVLDRLKSLGIRRDSTKGEQSKDDEQDTNKDNIIPSEAEENTIKAKSKNLEIPRTFEAVRKVSLGATFQWPRHKDTVEEMRAFKDDNKYELDSDVLDRLQSMGIRRSNEDTKLDTTIPLADTARLS